MGSRSRRKGAQWERDVANMLQVATGVDVARCLTEARDGNVGDLTTPLPIVVQCKVGQRPNPIQALREAIEAAAETEVPVAAVRLNGAGGRPPMDMAVLPLDDFAELLGLLRTCGAW